MQKFCLLIVLMFATCFVKGNTVFKKLFINRGDLVTVKGTTFPYIAFNETSVFSQTNAKVYLQSNDTLILCVKNNDTITHGFKFKDQVSAYNISVSDSIIDTLVYSQHSIHVFYDHLNYPDNKNLGLAGFIAVYEGSFDQCYLWNIKEHQSTYNISLASGLTVNWSVYNPDYYTINEKSFADIQLDTNAKITANVNDTVYIYIANLGQSMHSIHFHGFHPVTVYSNAQLITNGWEKDTWGLFAMDAVVLRMIPDKEGNYSVHDHNLTAVTGGNTHPNGMFTIMQINP